MSKDFIKQLIEKSSIESLEVIAGIKKEIGTLHEKRGQLVSELSTIDQQLGAIYDRIPDVAIDIRPRGRAKKEGGPQKGKPGRKRSGLKADLVVELMREAGKPMGVKEIVEGLVANKGVTSAENLDANVRTMLYSNRKGLFQKVDKGMFSLVG